MRSSLVASLAAAAPKAVLTALTMMALATVAIGCTANAPDEESTEESNATALTGGALLSRRVTKVSCDGGAAIVTYTDLVRSTGEVAVRDSTVWEVFDSNIVSHLRSNVLTVDNVGRDVPSAYAINVSSAAFGIVQAPNQPSRFFAQSRPTDDGSGLQEGTALRRPLGRGCDTGCAGKVDVTPGFYAHFEGTGLKLSFFRNEHRDLGISGRYLGDWYFQSCEKQAPVIVP
jgi:hypothetical protein